MAFKMKGMNHGEGTGSAFKQTGGDEPKWWQFRKRRDWKKNQGNNSDNSNVNNPKKTSKIDQSIAAMEEAYTGKASGKDYNRDIGLFKDAYGDDASKSLIAKLNQSSLQDYERPQNGYTAEKPYEAADVGRGKQVGLFNPVKPRFDFGKVDYGRGPGGPRTEWKKHTTEELKQIIKDQPHRFGGWDPVEDAGRMDEVLRPSKIAYADKYGKWRGGKAVRYEYGDRVRFEGIDEKRKKEILAKQKARQEADKARKSKFISSSSSTLKAPKVHPMDMKVKPTTGKWATPLKFGRKYKK